VVDHFLIGIGRVVGEEGVHFLEGRRQTGKIEADAFEETFLIRFGVHGKAILASPSRTK
jgi:hypothetical protein